MAAPKVARSAASTVSLMAGCLAVWLVPMSVHHSAVSWVAHLVDQTVGASVHLMAEPSVGSKAEPLAQLMAAQLAASSASTKAEPKVPWKVAPRAGPRAGPRADSTVSQRAD